MERGEGGRGEQQRVVEESLFRKRKEDRRGEHRRGGRRGRGGESCGGDVNPLKATGRHAGPLHPQACQTVLRSATEEEGDGLTDGG